MKLTPELIERIKHNLKIQGTYVGFKLYNLSGFGYDVVSAYHEDGGWFICSLDSDRRRIEYKEVTVLLHWSVMLELYAQEMLKDEPA